MSISRAFRNARMAHTLNFLNPTTIENSSDTSGKVGDIIYDNNYAYIRTPEGWKRVSINTFSATPVPETIAGLQLWLDASDASTLYDATSGGSLVAADGSVARWEDKSGNNRHFTQSTSGKRPVRKLAEQNGLDSLLFDGADDVLDGGNIIAGTTGLTIFVLLKRANTSANHRIFHKIEDGLPGWALNAQSGGKVKFEAYANAALNQYTSRESSSAVTLSDYSVLQVSVPSGSTETTSMRRNASTIAMDSAVYVNGGSPTIGSSTASLLIGGNRYQGIDYNLWPGNIAEILIYNSALSDADREAVENYLLAKWGITP